MKEAVHLYIVRHGETYFNFNQRVQGWCDTPLTQRGKEVAVNLGKGIRDIRFDAAYSSDSGRARETRDLILQHAQQAEVERFDKSSIRELFFGNYEGEIVDVMWRDLEARNRLPLQAEAMLKRMDYVHHDDNLDAETIAQFTRRIQGGLADILAEAQAKGQRNILIVSHGVTISQWLNDIDASIALTKSPRNASVAKIIYDGAYQLEYFDNIDFSEKGALL